MKPAFAGEEGSALWLGWVGLATVGLILVLVVDLAAYLVAGARAQGAADAAALAAVALSDPRGGLAGDPRAAATQVAVESGGELRRCICAHRRGEVEVTVAVPVRALAVTRFAGRVVTATSKAHLVPTDGPAP
ncbi:MAG: pilus assembly protein TadG-related protein [Nitriliruptorales bacterium]